MLAKIAKKGSSLSHRKSPAASEVHDMTDAGDFQPFQQFPPLQQFPLFQQFQVVNKMEKRLKHCCIGNFVSFRFRRKLLILEN